jgi:hypothetical protein
MPPCRRAAAYLAPCRRSPHTRRGSDACGLLAAAGAPAALAALPRKNDLRVLAQARPGRATAGRWVPYCTVTWSAAPS